MNDKPMERIIQESVPVHVQLVDLRYHLSGT